MPAPTHRRQPPQLRSLALAGEYRTMATLTGANEKLAYRVARRSCAGAPDSFDRTNHSQALDEERRRPALQRAERIPAPDC